MTGIQDQEFTVTDVIEGKEYVFRVSACNKCGAGEPAYMDEPVNVSSPASQFQHTPVLLFLLIPGIRSEQCLVGEPGRSDIYR